MGSFFDKVFSSILDWTKEEKQGIDRKTRKLITMHRGLHPKSNTNRIYIPRKEGSRGLLSIEDTVDLAKLGLKSYVRNSCERLLVAARQIEDCQGESVIQFKNRKKIERQQEWKDRTLHGQFFTTNGWRSRKRTMDVAQRNRT